MDEDYILLFDKKYNFHPGDFGTVYTGAKKDWHPYYINTIEMRSLWMEIKYIQSPAKLLNKV